MTFDLRGMDEHCPTRDRSAEVVSYTGERNLSERNCSTGVAVTAGERQCVRFAPEFKKKVREHWNNVSRRLGGWPLFFCRGSGG